MGGQYELGFSGSTSSGVGVGAVTLGDFNPYVVGGSTRRSQTTWIVFAVAAVLGVVAWLVLRR